MNFIKDFKKMLKMLIKKYKKLYVRALLTALYGYAIANLGYSLKNTLGYFPEILYLMYPFMEKIFNLKIFKILASPEKTYLFYMALIEICINRPNKNIPIILKYNILLIFLMEMMQNIIICYWDLLFNRENLLSNDHLYLIDKAQPMLLCVFIFNFFFIIYAYTYFRSMLFKNPELPGFLNEITKSVAFWLKLKKN